MGMALIRICWALVLATFMVTGALAQTEQIKDFARWSTLAEEAEQAVETEDIADTRLEELRVEIVAFRSQFNAARDLNATRIATLREQLVALGPLPEGEGAVPESADVAATRAGLNAQLSELLVPVQRAEAEFVRADAIVSQIDRALRNQQAEELLSTSPSPLNPVHWQPALRDFSAALLGLWNQTPDPDTALADMGKENTLPATVVFTVLGLVLVLRGRRWSLMIVQGLRRFGGRGLGIWGFLASLLRIILPVGGLLLLAIAAASSRAFGPDVEEMLVFLAALSGVMLGVRWVSERVFAREEDEALVGLPDHCRRELRFQVGMITALIVVISLIAFILEKGDPAAASEPVLVFPLLVFVSLSLLRIGLILRGYEDTAEEAEGALELRSSTLLRVVRGFGTGAIVIAVITPVLIALGYYRAGDALMQPYIMTMALLGLAMALQRFAADVYGSITGQGAQARDSLMSVVFGILLLLLLAPLLALVWGVRVNDLTELWQIFLRGFAVGESRISPTDFITFAVIFVLGYVLTRLVQSALRSNVLPKTRMDIGGQNAVVSGVGYLGIFLAALAAITGAGIDLSSLAIVAGALSVGIGFGLQNIVSNFVSGIILLIERPISEGDWIEVGGQMGYVRDISVRSTRIETFDKTDVIVPNADLVSGTVTNYTRGNTVGRVIVPVGVAYGTDTKRVEGILREIAQAQPMVLAAPAPSVLFVNFGADSLDFEVRCFLRDVNWMMVVKSDINHAIAERFSAEGIEIPFAQRDVWLRNPEALRVDAKNAQAPAATTGPNAQGATT